MSTQAFYEANAAKYFDKTLALDVSGVRGRFLEYVPKGGKLLDAGSGSGRDSRAFKDAGYSVGAFDSSPALARLSTEYSGVPTQVCTFQAFHSESDYDGIWACAALLHLRMTEVPAAVRNLKKALRPGGAIYMSFKYGTSERIAPDGRHFSDFDMAMVLRLASDVGGLDVRELWKYGGLATQPVEDTWLNVIAIKG